MKYLETKALKTGWISTRRAPQDISAVMLCYKRHSQCCCNAEAHHSEANAVLQTDHSDAGVSPLNEKDSVPHSKKRFKPFLEVTYLNIV